MPPEKIIKLAERKGVKRELLRWAWTFFSQARPDFQDDFDMMMKNYAVCSDVKMWDATTWLTMHETLANVAVALEKKPREVRRKLLHEHPQSMVERSATSYQEVWATASCNVVALHSDPDKANEPDFNRKARHMAVLDLLRAFHDEMRGFLPRRSHLRPTYFQDLLGLESFRFFLDGEALTDRRSLFDFDCRSLVALWHETFPSPKMGDNPNCCLSLLTWTHSPEVHRILSEWRAAFSPVSTPRLVADFKVTLGALDDESHYGHGLGRPDNGNNIGNYPYWSDPDTYAAHGSDEAHDRLFAASNFKPHVRAEMAADFARKSDEIVADSDIGWAALTDDGEDGDLDDVVEWTRPWIRAVGDLCMFAREARNHSVGSSASKRPVDNEDGSSQVSALERRAEVYLELLMTVHWDIERNEGGFWDTTLKQIYPFEASGLIEFWRRVQHPQDVIPWIESPTVRENLLSWAWAFYSDDRQTFQFGLREALADKERRRVEHDVTEATAW
ncbi:hypothetical protein DBV05_g2584 [Lasiodiplodia theobromae]|uniref:Uncharacterized protein n=1 Tax=Lasiodiplodia theobromae TaxID=45133 RepID=A0A5N5DLU7_9PEZI|nr:hypothetical protein DBV05_g2584 [Lasiodiplodia theobromae]